MSITMPKLSLLQKSSNAVFEVVHWSMEFWQTTPNSQIILSLPASMHVTVNAVSLFSILHVHVNYPFMNISLLRSLKSTSTHPCLCICMHRAAYMCVWLDTVYLMFYESPLWKGNTYYLYMMPSLLSFKNKWKSWSQLVQRKTLSCWTSIISQGNILPDGHPGMSMNTLTDGHSGICMNTLTDGHLDMWVCAHNFITVAELAKPYSYYDIIIRRPRMSFTVSWLLNGKWLELYPQGLTKNECPRYAWVRQAWTLQVHVKGLDVIIPSINFPF